MLSRDSQVIFLLCADLPLQRRGSFTSPSPLRPAEWHELALKINSSGLSSPGDLLNLEREEITRLLNLNEGEVERISALLARAGQAVFELEKYMNQGYELITRADGDYPKSIRSTMRDQAPPLFWLLGDREVLRREIVSFIIPRVLDVDDITATGSYLGGISPDEVVLANPLHFENEYKLLEIASEKGFRTLGITPFGGLHYTRVQAVRELISDGVLTILSQSDPASRAYKTETGKSQKMVEFNFAGKIIDFLTGKKKTDPVTESVLVKLHPGRIIRFDDPKPIPGTRQVPEKAELTVNTIGHSNHKIETFIDLLEKNGIETVVDVRTVPSSSYNKQFNQAPLQLELKKKSINYLFLGDKLGGRPENTSLFNKEGKLIREMLEVTEPYLQGIGELLELAENGNIAIMCSEENPSQCHRGYIISHTLLESGVKVNHIRGNGTVNEGHYIYKEEIDQLELPFGDTE